MVELETEMPAYSRTISYSPKQVQMLECSKLFTTVSNQHRVLVVVPPDLQQGEWMESLETFITIILTTAATAQKEQFKEWKCIYENMIYIEQFGLLPFFYKLLLP